MSGMVHLSVRDTSKTAAARKHDEHFYRRLPVQPPQYSSDDTDLMPVTKKTGVVAVDLAEAKKLHIARTEKPATSFNPTELPTVRFRGSLHVSEAPEEDVVEHTTPEESINDVTETEAIDTTSTATDHAPVVSEDESMAPEDDSIRHLHITVKRDSKKKKSTAKTSTTRKIPLLSNPYGVIGMRRARVDNRNPKDTTLTVSASTQPRSFNIFYVLGLSTVAGIVVVAILAGLESHVAASNDTFASSYQFTLSSLVNAVKERFAALLVHSFGL